MRLAWTFVFVAACGDGTTSDDDGSTGDPDAGVDAGDDAGTPSCDLVSGATAEGDTLPGSQIALATTDAGSGRDYVVTWAVPNGTLSSDTGTTTTWTTSVLSAADLAEVLTVTATATSAGCEDDVVTVDVSLDWPERMRTMVIYSTNAAAARSIDVANRYADFRDVPPENVCAVDAGANVDVLAGSSWSDFVDAVDACVESVGRHVHYLVPVWGVPYKLDKAIGFFGGPAGRPISLDAMLVFGRDSVSFARALENPLYQPGDSMTGVYEPYVPFGQLRPTMDHDYYLVTRIDGADADAAIALVDRTEAADALARDGLLAGTVYVDGNRGLPHPDEGDVGSYEWGERNIVGVETVFTTDGRYPVVADYNSEEFGTAPAPLECPDALYYAGWYSFGHYNDVFTWNTGAIGGHLDSCSACDIRTERDWSAVALRRGITATFGAVAEPYVTGMPEYDQFFEYLLQGGSYGEAAYESTIVGVWMMVWIGDPLYRPYGI